MKKRNCICIADTPYQIISCIRFRWMHLRNFENIDLIVINQFKNCELYVKSVRNSRIFNNVVISKKIIKKSKFDTTIFANLFNCKLLLEENCSSNEKYFLQNKYDTLVCSILNRDVININNIYKPESIYLVDDGVGSYIGDVTSLLFTGLHKEFYSICWRLFKRGIDYERIKGIYLSNLDFQLKNNYKLFQFSRLNCKQLEILRNIFGVISIDSATKAIFLTVPLHDNNIDINTYHKVLDELSIVDGVFFKRHPRDLETTRYIDRNILDSNGMWELSVESFSDSIYLISIFSTAQFTPKLLYGKEPYVVFLLGLFEGFLTESRREECFETINKLKSWYKRPEKIICISTFSELQVLINSIKDCSVLEGNNVNEGK